MKRTPRLIGPPAVSISMARRVLKRGRRIGSLANSQTRKILSEAMTVFLSEDERRRRAFQVIYRKSQWGNDGRSRFFSGIGSTGSAADLYVNTMADLLKKHASEKGRALTIVDVGCGDFRVGSALLKKLPGFAYIGCDIVPELIVHNIATHANDQVAFRVLDAVRDSLPEGDVCLVRQVLQHLPNRDIQKIMDRLQYPIIYVTEGHPVVHTGPINPDKEVGADVRFNWETGWGRGVELSQPPFGLPVVEICRFQNSATEIIVTEQVLKQFVDPILPPPVGNSGFESIVSPHENGHVARPDSEKT